MTEDTTPTIVPDTRTDEFAKLMLGTAAGFIATLIVAVGYDTIKQARANRVPKTDQ